MRLSILKGYLDEDCLLGLRSLMESLGMPVKVEEILKENVVEDTKSDKIRYAGNAPVGKRRIYSMMR